LMELAHLALVYTSTTGLEMALRGKPVIVAGRAYYGRKGFTRDADDPAHYDALLQAGDLSALRPGELELARRYACLFFFRHHIPFPLMHAGREKVEYTFDDLAALRAGADPWLDLVCDAVLDDKPFLYTGEL
jgi:hypothetical protein